MVKVRILVTAAMILATVVGCNGLAGIREGIFDPCVQDASDPVCSATGTTATSGSGSASASASATSGGTGGFRATCGNGVVDSGEECDEEVNGRGCTQCKVDCAELGAFNDPTTSHCYWVPAEEMNFFKSSVICQSSPGGRLATVTSASELGVIATHVVGAAWIGASAYGPTGELSWLDGEPWGYAPWAPEEPSLGGLNLCLMLGGSPALFAMDDCAQVRASLCERGP